MEIVVSEELKAPRRVVFDVFSEVGKAAERISAIEKLEILSDVSTGKGVRWRETRTVFGKEATEEMQMTEHAEPERYVVEAESNGTHYISTFRYDPVDENTTRVTWAFRGTPKSSQMRYPSALLPV